jgi:1,4-alpha-glucan branching enzyme
MYKCYSILPGEDPRSLAKKKGDQRKPPMGAEVLPSGGVSFRIWAPNHRRLLVTVEGGSEVDLKPEGGLLLWKLRG